MPLILDFILPRHPLSHQAKDKTNLNAWRNYVYGRAHNEWPVAPIVNYPLKFTMVYLTDEPNSGDINNFVKPVQDALCSKVYADDNMIKDVSAHMRLLSDPLTIQGLPPKLAFAVVKGQPCVYVAIHDSAELVDELT